nr:unnamed protein product [Digitaria exilis]
MTPSNASGGPPASDPAAATGGGSAAAFGPCMWNDFFRSEEWMTERVNRLREEVRQMFEAMTMSAADTLKLVDTLERLGIDDYFREKIDVAMSSTYATADVFGKFTDATGGFSTSLVSDPRGLLSLYNAAHLAAPGEDALDEAIAFSRGHLEAMKGELGSPLAEQVSRALEIPLPRFPKRLETMRYVAEYEEEEGHRGVLLELARLDFNLLRSLHLKELKDLTLWWKHTYSTVKLRYARDRLVENYFWTCGVFHEAKYSRARMMFAKTAGLLSMMDDTYDVHATLEECCKLNEAIQRYNLIFLDPDKFFLPNVSRAKWSREKYAPSFDEHLQVSAMSSLFPAMAVVLLLGAGDDVATKEAFEWAIGVPDVVSAGAEITRYLNDIASYKLGKNQEDVASSVECYAREHGVTVEDAAAAIAGMAERAWRRINEWCMGDVPVAVLPAAELVVNLARTMEVMYLGGRDAYTFGADLKGLIAALFLEPVPI